MGRSTPNSQGIYILCSQKYSPLLGSLGRGGSQRRGLNIFGVRVLIFVNRTATVCFCLSVIKVVQYLEDRLAHVLMQTFSNRPRGFYTVAQKIRKFILFWQFLEFTTLYLRNDKEYRHIRSTKNKGGYLPCAAVPFILSYWRIFPQLSTGWVKASLVQFCNLNFFDNFWSLLPYISETTENLGTQWIPEIKAGFSPVRLCHLYRRIFPETYTRWAKT